MEKRWYIQLTFPLDWGKVIKCLARFCTEFSHLGTDSFNTWNKGVINDESNDYAGLHRMRWAQLYNDKKQENPSRSSRIEKILSARENSYTSSRDSLTVWREFRCWFQHDRRTPCKVVRFFVIPGPNRIASVWPHLVFWRCDLFRWSFILHAKRRCVSFGQKVDDRKGAPQAKV